MNFNRRSRPKIDISMTPMIDVVFLLLIFFMVTTTFDRTAALNVTLPPAKGQETAKITQSLVLAIDAQGLYYLGENEQQPAKLAEQSRSGLLARLQRISASDPDLPVLIRADANTPHKAVITAMDVLGLAGLKKITFAAVQLPE
ncbi:MAG: biopolymer transporter ExbD [Methylococcales bacterium]|nr:biopolymer transporter ExbD [Methylococcales bacterium]